MGRLMKGLAHVSGLFAATVCLAQTPTHGIQEFTKTATFVVPAGVLSLTVELWGAGGGGGGGTVGGLGPGSGGGGGGSGAYLKSVLAVQSGQSYTVEVGRGGAGGSGESVKPFGSGESGGDSAIRLDTQSAVDRARRPRRHGIAFGWSRWRRRRHSGSVVCSNPTW